MYPPYVPVCQLRWSDEATARIEAKTREREAKAQGVTQRKHVTTQRKRDNQTMLLSQGSWLASAVICQDHLYQLKVTEILALLTFRNVPMPKKQPKKPELIELCKASLSLPIIIPVPPLTPMPAAMLAPKQPEEQPQVPLHTAPAVASPSVPVAAGPSVPETVEEGECHSDGSDIDSMDEEDV